MYSHEHQMYVSSREKLSVEVRTQKVYIQLFLARLDIKFYANYFM